MGNWMTVNLRGSLAAEDVEAASLHLRVKDDYSNFRPLSIGLSGLCGLGDWVRQNINADGNLAERDYSVESVADNLREIVAVAPSLELKVHCGGDYESTNCVATITVSRGEVTVGDPEVEVVNGIGDDVFKGRLFGAIGGFGGAS